MKRQAATGVDIGSSQIKAVSMELPANGEKPRILGFSAVLSQGLKRGEIIDQKDFTASIQNCLKKCRSSSGAEIEDVYLAVDGESLKSFRAKGVAMVSRADGEITQNDVERAVESAKGNLGQLVNREIIHSIPVSFKIDDNLQTQNPLGLKGMRLETDALFITTLGRNLRNLIRGFETNKVTVLKIISSPLASSRLLLSRSQKEVGVLLLDIGGTTLSLAVFEEGVPISMEVLPLGADHISHDIAVGFQIPLEEAEEVKMSFSSGNIGRDEKRKMEEIIEARFSDIFELVERHLRKIGRHSLLPSGVVLTGGGANMAGIGSYAKNFLRLPSSVYLPKEAFEADDDNLYLPQWAVASGLCLTAFDDLKEGRGLFDFNAKPSFFLRWLRSLLP